jgi:hypothetical protein
MVKCTSSSKAVVEVLEERLLVRRGNLDPCTSFHVEECRNLDRFDVIR